MYSGQDPYQGQQQFRDPSLSFGQSRDEGTIEEHIHRTAVKRMDHHRMPHVLARSSGKAAIIFGAVGIVLAAAALSLLMLYKGSATAQMNQMQQQITAQGQQIQALQTKQVADARSNAGLYRGLSGQITDLDNAMNAWPLVCGGVGTDYFPCSSTRP
jgi:hypothetical protein